MVFEHANQGAWVTSGKQVGAQDEDFSAVSQKDLTQKFSK